MGHQGRKYIQTLKRLGLSLKWASNKPRFDADSIIIATPAESHYEISKKAILLGRNVIIEKPMVMSVKEAEELYELSIKKNITGFVDHTHLYSQEFRKLQGPFERAFFTAGGPCKTNPIWDWGSHGVAMAIHLRVPCTGHIYEKRHAVLMTCYRGNEVFAYQGNSDTQPLETLITEFLQAKHDQSGIKMGLDVAYVLCK